MTKKPQLQSIQYDTKAIKLFKTAIEESFQDIILFSCITGRMAIGKQDLHVSDVDILIVLKDVRLKNFEKKRERFVQSYHTIHNKLSYVADSNFPGEYLTEKQLQDCINGRGWDNTKTCGNLIAKPIENYKEAPIEHDYMIHRSMLFIGKFLSGNEEIFKQKQSEVIQSMVKFICYENHKKNLTLEEIVKSFITRDRRHGYTEKYSPNFEIIMTPKIEEGILNLVKDGYLTCVSKNVWEKTKKFNEWTMWIYENNKEKLWNSKPIFHWKDKNDSVE